MVIIIIIISSYRNHVLIISLRNLRYYIYNKLRWFTSTSACMIEVVLILELQVKVKVIEEKNAFSSILKFKSRESAIRTTTTHCCRMHSSWNISSVS